MKPITAEWVEKAEGDFRSAQREQRVRVHPNPDLVCFLCQQCAEKYLKALLVEMETRFSKTHDLLALLKLVLPVAPVLASLRDKLEPLNDYAVEFRYPSETATREEAKAALANCLAVRKETRKCLGLDGPPSAQLHLRVTEKRARYRTRSRKR